MKNENLKSRHELSVSKMPWLSCNVLSYSHETFMPVVTLKRASFGVFYAVGVEAQLQMLVLAAMFLILF